MKRPSITVLIVFYFCSLASARQSDESRCLDQIRVVVGKLNVLYARQNAPLLPFDSAQLTYERSYDNFRQMPVIRVGLTLGSSMEYLPETGQIIDYTGTSITEGIFFDKKPVPQLTLSQASEEAKAWMKVVFGDLPPYLSPPRGSFTSNMRDTHRYYSGEWLIKWQRLDSQGHPFELDGLAAIFCENLGLIGCTDNFDSIFDEPKGPAISMEEALAAARPVAEAWLNNKVLTSGSHARAWLGRAQSELWVVNPNNFFQSQNLDQVANNPHARLAWKVQYPLVTDGPESPFTRSLGLVVKIDALTKEVIGGDLRNAATIGKQDADGK